jgi:hypothetical protein
MVFSCEFKALPETDEPLLFSEGERIVLLIKAGNQLFQLRRTLG